ncbi:Mycobacterium numidiamassiliense ORFan [Mycobacterium numidiamassiliense]|uniref:Mycobacterium numidiamassiliense ORFan n=1 Tax=Mycobacterium numidiamassiliense TaxID=1841861 RepID=A0A2U3PIR6_9MYCO|nr:Mycobacterium numidiamassiliense ORFan [Mycobacterium numidiamassiliense]
MAEPTPTDPSIAQRIAMLERIPEFEPRRTFGIETKHRLTTGEQLERALLAAAQSKYIETGDLGSLLDFRKSLAAPQQGTSQAGPPKDSLDWVRVVATLIMVTALFVIVYVVAIKPNPGQSTGAAQLVSLASGLAGIGLGWLFGTGTARGRK